MLKIKNIIKPLLWITVLLLFMVMSELLLNDFKNSNNTLLEKKECLGSDGKKHIPNQPITIDPISNIAIHNVFSGNYINKKINVSYEYDTQCFGVECRIDNPLTLYSSISSHKFDINIEFDSTTNCTSFNIKGFLPADVDNDATYTASPPPTIIISYIPIP